MGNMEKYFTGLNYSLANEDSSVEKELSLSAKKILTVCGSGCRALSLLRDGLEELNIVDISSEQLEYTRFKFELIKKMNYEEYLKFMGLKDSSYSEKLEIFAKYSFSSSVYKFKNKISKDSLFYGLVYSGRWESFLRNLGRSITFLTGYSDFNKDFEDVKHCQKYWPEKRLEFLISLLAHPRILNRFLYKGQMIDLKNSDLGQFLIQNFKSAFMEKDPKKSFFHQMLFLDKVKYSQGYPLEFQHETFLAIKNYQGKINYLQMDLKKAINEIPFDFASLSNVPSYFNPSLRQEFEKQLCQVMTQRSACVVMRSFLREDLVSDSKLQSWLSVEKTRRAELQDSTMLYKFQILENL